MATFVIHSFTQKTTFEIQAGPDRIESILIKEVGKLPVEAKPGKDILIGDTIFRVSYPWRSLPANDVQVRTELEKLHQDYPAEPAELMRL